MICQNKKKIISISPPLSDGQCIHKCRKAEKAWHIHKCTRGLIHTNYVFQGRIAPSLICDRIKPYSHPSCFTHSAGKLISSSVHHYHLFTLQTNQRSMIITIYGLAGSCLCCIINIQHFCQWAVKPEAELFFYFMPRHKCLCHPLYHFLRGHQHVDKICILARRPYLAGWASNHIYKNKRYTWVVQHN